VTDPRVKTVELKLREIIGREDYESMHEHGCGPEEYDEDMRMVAGGIVSALDRLEQSRAERALDAARAAVRKKYLTNAYASAGEFFDFVFSEFEKALTAPPPAQGEKQCAATKDGERCAYAQGHACQHLFLSEAKPRPAQEEKRDAPATRTGCSNPFCMNPWCPACRQAATPDNSPEKQDKPESERLLDEAEGSARDIDDDYTRSSVLLLIRERRLALRGT